MRPAIWRLSAGLLMLAATTVASGFWGTAAYAQDRPPGLIGSWAGGTSDSGRTSVDPSSEYNEALPASPQSVEGNDQEEPVVSITVATPEVTEGEDAVFRLRRSGLGSDPLLVGLQVGGHRKIMSAETVDITLTSENSNSAVDATVTFEAGESEVPFHLTTEDDNVNEGDGLLTVRIARFDSSPYQLGDARSAEVLVKDNDVPTVSIAMPELPEGMTLSDSGDTWEGSLTEGEAISFTIVCTGDYEYLPFPDLKRTYFTWVQEMNHPAFYTASAIDRGIIGNNETGFSQMFNCQDRTVPDPVGARKRFVGPDGGEVRIDMVPSNVGFSQTLRDLKDRYEAAAEEAKRLGVSLTAPGLFAGVRDTFIFQCDDELRFCPSYEVGSPNSIRVRVVNRDPVIVIKSESDEVTEGQAARFTLERLWNEENLSDTSPGWADTLVLIETSVAGTRVTDDLPSEITFGRNETTKTIEVATVADTAFNDPGSVTVAILPDTTGADQNLAAKYTTAVNWLGHTPPGGRSDRATVTVTDDDGPVLSVGFGEASYGVAEGGSVEVVVLLGADPGREVVIPLSVENQGGVSGADYSGVPGSVTFVSGVTEQTFVFEAVQDMFDDDGEAVVVGFGTLPAGVEVGTVGTSTVTITDDDGPVLSVGFGEASYGVAEGGSVEVVVLLGADPGREVVIPLSVENQGGVSGADYSGVPGSVTFVSRVTEQTFVFEAVQDMFDDDGEAVVVGFGTLPAGVEVGTVGTSTVTITDDDGPVLSVGFGEASYGVAEGGSVEVVVLLGADPGREVVIPLSVENQGGVSGADYSGVPGSVTFVSGVTEQTFVFEAVQDMFDDDGEAVVVGFGTLPAGVEVGTVGTSTVAITDDDRQGVVASPEFVELLEGESASYMVMLTAQPTEAVTISVIDPANPDIAAEPESLTFTVDDWDDEQMVTVYALQDADPEDETGKITHGVNGGEYVTMDPPTVSVMVLDDDPDCHGTAFWCATVEFADRSATDWGFYDLFYHRSTELPSNLTDTEFVYNGRIHTVVNMDLAPGIPPDSDSPPTGRDVERSTFHVSIMPGRWGQAADTGVPASDYLNWTLHVGDVELPFRDSDGPTRSDGRRGSFGWRGSVVQGLFSDWPAPTSYEVWLEETPYSEQLADLQTRPDPPRYLEVSPVDGGEVLARWWVPTDDGGSRVTGYRIEWKEARDSWEDPNAVLGVRAPPAVGHLGTAYIAGLTTGVDYTVRVLAMNDLGSSAPSNEFPGRPQAHTPRVSGATVDGDLLTLRFDRMLDESSVPATDAFRVLVNGGLRRVESVEVQGDMVRLVLSMAVSGADEVHVRHVPPTDLADPDALRDTDGNLAVSLNTTWFEEVSNETDRSTIRPLTARFVEFPDSHNGSDSFTFRVEFSESVWMERGTPRTDMIIVTGGKATSGWWLDRHTGVWEFTVQPDSDGDVTVVLPAERVCGTVGAPCASGDRRLSTRLELTVRGPGS